MKVELNERGKVTWYIDENSQYEFDNLLQACELADKINQLALDRKIQADEKYLKLTR